MRRLSPAGAVTMFVGSGAAGFVDATGLSAQFSTPLSLALRVSTGILYVADSANNRILAVATANAGVSTLAGNGVAATVDAGSGTGASFSAPEGLALDSAGGAVFLYVAERAGCVVRAVNLLSTAVSTLSVSGSPMLLDGLGVAAGLRYPTGLVCLAVAGEADVLLVADSGNSALRTINTTSGAVGTLLGAAGQGAAAGLPFLAPQQAG